MLPFDAPNPYGGYFNFDQLSTLANGPQNFGPGMAPGVMGAMGMGSGGFNPTRSEFIQNQVQRRYNDEFMSYVLRSDERAGVFRSMLMKQMTGGDLKKQAEITKLFGGQDKFAEVFSYALNRPEISSFVGGSIKSLGVGSLAVTSSGMVLNNRGFSGEGLMQTAAAQGVFRHVQSQFYHPSGGANLRMTQGMNMDQIGGIMTLASEQGAFAGLNLGKFKNGALTFNNGSLDKITDTVKNAAKALGQIIDVYGDGSVAELMQKANRITGLNFSRPEHVDLMRQRLQNMRTYSTMSGVNLQTVMDMAATGTQNLQGLGFSPIAAGGLSEAATRNALLNFNSQRANSGNYYTVGPSLSQLNFAAQRDLAGMAQDPVGARRAAVEMLIQTGTIKTAEAGKMRELAMGVTHETYGRLDSEIAGRYGIGLDSYIQQMGGVKNMLGQLQPHRIDVVSEANGAEMRKRQLRLLRQQAGDFMGGRFDSDEIDAMSRLTGELGGGTSKRLMEAMDKGMDEKGLQTIIAEDPLGRTRVKDYMSDVARLRGRKGDLASTAANLATMAKTNPLTSGFASESDHRTAIANQRRNAAIAANDVDRIRSGNFFSTMTQGFLEKMDARDPASLFAIVHAAYGADAIAGLNGGLNLDPAQLRKQDGEINRAAAIEMARNMTDQFRKVDANFMSRTFQMNGSHFGKDANGDIIGPNQAALEKFVATMERPELRAAAFADFREFRIAGPDGTMSSAFMKNTDAEYAAEYGGRGAMLEKMAQDMIFGTDSDANKKQQGVFLHSIAVSLRKRQDLASSLDGSGNISTRVVTPGLLGDDRAKQMVGLLDGFFSDYSNLEMLSKDQISGLAGANRQWGKSMMMALGSRVQNLQQLDREGKLGGQSGKLKDDLEKLQALRQMGIQPDAGRSYSINGELKLEHGALKLMHALLSLPDDALPEAAKK